MTDVRPPQNTVPGCPADIPPGMAALLARAAHDRRTIAVLTVAAARREAERAQDRRAEQDRDARLAELLDGYRELLRAFTVSKPLVGGPVWTARLPDTAMRRLARLVVEQEPDEEAA